MVNAHDLLNDSYLYCVLATNHLFECYVMCGEYAYFALLIILCTLFSFKHSTFIVVAEDKSIYEKQIKKYDTCF